MILMRFLPQILKEMLKNVPSLLFDVVDWKELTHVLPLISKRMLNPDQVMPLVNQIAPSFKSYNLSFSDELIGKKSIEARSDEQKLIANSILQAYFQQLFNKEGQLLDMRPEHFSFEDRIIYWKAGGMWAKWNEDFRLGLIEVYKGFYLENEEQFRRGLTSIGLIQPEWAQSEKDKMAGLFRNHFKDSLSENMRFNIEEFKKSFLNIFHLLLDKKVRMSADFMYLGFMLVTLYIHLEVLQEPLPVKDIFLEVMKANET